MTCQLGVGDGGRQLVRWFTAPCQKRRMLRLLPILLSALLPWAASALDPGTAVTQYARSVWGAGEGLPGNSVTRVCQGADGYLWVATMSGLARFDGVRFVTYTKANTPVLAENGVSALIADGEGTVWFSDHLGNLYRHRDRRFERVARPFGQGSEYVSALCTGRQGTLWAGGSEGQLARVDREGSSRLFDPCPGTTEPIRGLCESPSNTLWAVSEGGGLLRIEGERVRILTKADGLTSNSLSCLAAGRDGSLWIGSYGGGLCRLKDGRVSAWGAREGLPSTILLSLCEDRDGNLWVGTYAGGIVRLSGGKTTTFTSKSGLSNDFVTSIFEDSEGSLWAGTLGGLEQFRDGRMVTFGPQEGLSDEMVYCVLETSDGALWIGTRKGLNRFRDGKIQILGKEAGLGDEQVWSLAEDGRGALWVGTRAGLTRLQGGRATTLTARDGLTNPSVLAICPSRDGTLWVGTDGGGLNHLAGGRFSTLASREGLPNDTVVCIAEDRRGRLWIATRGRACVLEGGMLRTLPVNAWSLLVEEDGTVWLATLGHGLVRVADGGVQECSSRHGLFDDQLFRVLLDREGVFWIASPRGIFSVPKAEVVEALEGRRPSVSCTTFGHQDGLRSVEGVGGSQPNGCVTQAGTVWLPTLKGVVAIEPRPGAANPPPLPVVLEEVTADGEAFDPREPLHLKPGTEDVEFRFTSPTFLAPQHVRFRYRIEGLDRDWREAADQRTALYSRIPPGTYTFSVAARGRKGGWSEPGATARFVLEPHFYQTPWFYALTAVSLLLAALLSGVGIQQVRVLQARRRAAVLQQLVDERTADLAEANKAIRKEQQRSEDLLVNILPVPIAERLKAGERTIADDFQEVSNLFCDIVGFTKLSARVPAREVVELLHEVVTEFDRLALALGLEKIKTIGDAYHAAAGIPTPQEDHARRVAEMALGMVEIVGRIGARRGIDLQVRIGIHSGPVIAGVIGTRKFTYDLWSEAVNLASRLESHGVPGKIQASDAIRERLKDGYLFEYRGEMEMKNVGPVRTWFLLGRKPKE